MEYSVRPVLVSDVDRVFCVVGPGLDEACRRTGGEIGAPALWQRCRDGSAFLFVILEGEAIIGASVWCFEDWTEFGRVFRCLSLYGRHMQHWLVQHREIVVTVALAGGASGGLLAEGRGGWGRVFRGEAREVRRLFLMGVGNEQRQQNHDD
jgi:hypothetical protein